MSFESGAGLAAINENREVSLIENHQAWIERAKKYGSAALGLAMIAGFGAVAGSEGKDIIRSISGQLDAGFLDYLAFAWAAGGVERGIETLAGQATNVRKHWDNIVNEFE
jgi:hypothetical protein